jgi:gluconolactonase
LRKQLARYDPDMLFSLLIAATLDDSALDTILLPESKVEKIADGFIFTEGPIWVKKGGYLLFSDIPANTIYKYKPNEKVELFRKPSGYDGADLPAGAFWGSNGLTLDKQGRLTICEHGHRRVTRLEPDGKLTVLADKFEGKRFNAPNDAVYRSNGDLYFTDPPYGPVQGDDDPKKEIPFNGVYRLTPSGKIDLLEKELTRPNGLAFSPDEKTLYVANSDSKRKIWMSYPVRGDGLLGKGKLFFDATHHEGSGVPDGMKVDQKGNLYCTGPGGVLVFSPEAKHLGTIKFPETTANLHWGDEDGKTLYVTATTGLYRIKLAVPGRRP